MTKGTASVALLGSAAFMVTADVRVVNPLLHIIANDFNTDVGTAGLIVTAYAIPYGFFQLVYGPLADRIGKLRVITWTLAVFAVGTALCALSPSLLILALLRFLTGAAAAATISMSLAYIGDTFPYEERQVAIGGFLTAVALGNILSTSLGGIVSDFLNWHYIFLLYGLATGVILWRLWLTARVSPVPEQKPKVENLSAYLKPYFELLKNPAPRLVIVGVFIEGFFFFGGFSFLGAFLRDRYNLAYILIGFMLSGFGMGSLVYSRSVRWLVKKLGENGLILLGGSLTFICYLLISLVESWPLFIPVNMLLGLGYYMFHSTLQTKATELAPGARGTAVSLFAFSLFIGQGIGIALLGLVVDGPGYVLAFIIAGVGMVLLAGWFVYKSVGYERGGLIKKS